MKLSQLRKIIREIITEETKIYINKSQSAPKNKKIHTGPRGGKYFLGTAKEKQQFEKPSGKQSSDNSHGALGKGLDKLQPAKNDSDAISNSAKNDERITKLLRGINEKVKQAKQTGEKIPDYDLCKISIPGTNLFCQQSKNIPRKEMPQLKGVPEKGSWGDKNLKKDAKGEVNGEEVFKKFLKKKGVKLEKKNMDVTKLKATQNQLVGAKIAGMLDALANKSPEETKGIREPIFVSKDGYILDGHHRWAAMVGLDIADGNGPPVDMDVVQVDMGIEDLVNETNKFAEKIGIKPKAASAVKESKEVKNKPCGCGK